jgi:glycosyltransferase involved in cell wall biosynthesis
MKVAGIIYGFLKRIVHLIYCISPDYIFIHRELTPVGPPVFEWLIAKILRKKIIYDFDDAIWYPNTSEENKFVSNLKWHKKFHSICKWSFRISCCNNFLAEQAGKNNLNIKIIPTTIDTARFFKNKVMDRNNDRIIIGWTGTHSTLPYLDIIIDQVQQITKLHPDILFRIICNKKPDWNFSNIQFIQWNKSTEIHDLSDISIGVMPLPDSDWSRGKCGFKILQYFALGIPAIASPVGINREIIDHGKNGFLCNNKNEWFDYLHKLIESSELREELGRNGRITVEKNYSLDVNRTNFLDLFEWDNRRKSPIM